ncbi:MAG: BTAD domain-containing putative transcriptional regulator, partial [Gemmatimonadaceae bacterium]
DDLWLDPGRVASDLARFDAAMQDGDAEAAVELYRGVFAEGFHVSGASDFERWLEQTRERYHRGFRQALEAVATRLDAAGEPRRAADTWLRLAAEDPAYARVLVHAMRSLDAAGNRGAARRQAGVYEAFVRAEFGADPAPEVSDLVTALRRAQDGETGLPMPGAVLAGSVVGVGGNGEDGGRGRVEGGERTGSDAAVPGARPRLPARLWVAAAVSAAVIIFAVGRSVQRGAAATNTNGRTARTTVLPFTQQGAPHSPDLGEAFAEVLAAALDGVGASGGGGASMRGLVETGSVHEAGGRLRVRATLQGDGGAELAEASAEGSVQQPFDLVDGLALQLIASRWSHPWQRTLAAAARSTTSLEALKAYLAGEKERGAGRFAPAAEWFARAVAADTAFALGYYRLSMTTLAADLPMAEAEAADELAARHALRLSETERLLLRGYAAFREGDPEVAEQLYGGVVATYPDDVEAWRQLGETFFHYNPLRGRPISEARAAFERVLAREPGDWDALWHLALLDLHDGDRRRAQGRLQALAALRPGAGHLLEVRTLAALAALAAAGRAQKSAALPEALSAELSRADELLLHRLVWRSAVYLGDLDAAGQIARLSVSEGRPRHGRFVAERDLAMLEFARGRWRAGQARLAGATLAIGVYRETEIFTRVLFAVNPAAPRPAAELRALRDTLSGLPVNGEGSHRAQYLALLDAALGDTAAALRAARRMEGVRPAGATLIRAAVALVRGDGRAAAREFETGPAQPFGYFGLALTNFEKSRMLERFLYAEALRTSGRSREALGYYASFGEHAPHDLAFLGPAHMRMAEIYEGEGDTSRARDHYSRFIGLWGGEGGDAELRPLIEQARARLAGLDD